VLLAAHRQEVEEHLRGEAGGVTGTELGERVQEASFDNSQLPTYARSLECEAVVIEDVKSFVELQYSRYTSTLLF